MRVTPAKRGLNGQTMKFSPFFYGEIEEEAPFFFSLHQHKGFDFLVAPGPPVLCA